jgi:DNA-binding beta-propeller fold protein YncE
MGHPVAEDRDRPALVPRESGPAILPTATIRPGSPPIKGGMVVQIDARTGAIRDTITLGGYPALPTEAGGYLWWFNFGDGSISRIDRASGRLAETLQFDDGAAATLAHGDELWVTADQHDLIRLDGRTGSELERFTLGRDLLFRTGDAGFLAFAGGSVWVTVPDIEHPRDPHEVWRIDPETGDVVARLTIDPDPNPLVTLDDVIYAASPTRNTITRIDSATNDATSVQVGREPVAVAHGAGSIWVAHGLGLSIWRMDPSSLVREATIELGEPINNVAFGNGRLWATTRTSLHEIDPATNRVVATTRLRSIPHPRGPVGILVVGDSVWVGIEGP